MPVSDPRHLDKFFTRPDVARCCMDFLSNMTSKGASVDLWVEPSAGSGAFLDLLPTPSIGIDLSPEAPGIIEQDFLTWKPHVSGRIVTVGNPPFGKNASKAVSFFNHAAGFSDVIGMIFPRTFEKASLHRRLDQRFTCRSQMTIESRSFTFVGEPYDVPAIFQVWERSAQLRIDASVRRVHPDFEFVDRSSADLAFQRVGRRAGAVKTDFAGVGLTSHLFIRSRSLPGDVLVERLRDLCFADVRARTAGNPSIAKSELIDIYSRRFGGID